MAAASVEVLCQNGRREKVKVQPGTPLLEVIDEVCSKQGLDPSRHRLVHNKKQLDATLQFRYSGLLNNAKLELVEAEGGDTKAQVALALQMPDGERFMETFSVDTTLFDMLNHFQQSKGKVLTEPVTVSGIVQQPSCIYAQTEVTGLIALKATNLRNLGLTGGRVVLRFMWKDISVEQLQEIEREITARQEKARKLEARRTQVIAETAAQEQQMELQPQEQQPPPNGDSGATTKPPEMVRLRSVFDDGPVVSAFGNHGRERSMFDHEPAKPAPPQPVRVESMFLSRNETPEPISQFAEFKFPEETKGQDLYRNEMSENVNELTKPCDREPLLYNEAEARAAHEPEEELPDDFYEVTKEDLQVMHQDLVRQASLTLSTQASRRYERYERAIVRVHFPTDGLVLQAVFRPSEPVFALYKFVRAQLEGQCGNTFILYTPPRRILSESDMAETFASAGLLPAVNIFASNRQGSGPIHVSSEARSKLQAPFESAKNIVSKWFAAAHLGDIDNQTTSGVSAGAQSQQPVQQISPTSEGAIRPPKWFKMK